ncbi:MAG: ABC transporter substrate-binding protein [Pyrinomonadaceae bacterium]
MKFTHRPRRSLLLVLLVILFGACQQPQQPTATPEPEQTRERVVGTRGGSVKYRLEAPPKTLNYLMASDVSSLVVSFYLLGGRLVEFNHDEQRYIPSIAESWKLNEDGRTVEVLLRDGLKFSDGQALTTEDVAFTFRALYDERTASPLFRDAMLIGGRPIEVSVTDARNLRLTFPEFVAAPENYLSNLAVLPRHKLEESFKNGTLRDAYALTSDPQSIVIAGAFTVESVQPGERVTFKRNPNYWKKDSAGTQLPYLDSLTVEVVSDANNAVTRLQQNALDVVDRVRPTDYATLRTAQGSILAFDNGPGLNTDHLWFNLNPGAANNKSYVEPTRLAWFNDVRFRRAVAHAIDREAIASSTLQGLATPLYGFVSPGNRAWGASDVPKIEYDLEKSRALLREAGFESRGSGDAPELFDAKGNRVEFTLIVQAENEPRVKMATVIQEDLAQLGIRMHVAPIETGELTRRISQSFDYEAALFGTAVSEPDPSSYTNFLRSNSATHQWFPKQAVPATEWERRVDELVLMQSRERDVERRKAIFRDVQIILAEQMPIVPIVARHVATAANKRIGNYRPSTVIPFSLWNVEELFLRQ